MNVEDKCPRCGFTMNDKVKMQSALVRVGTGKPIGIVHGIVKDWPDTGCHIVEWGDVPIVTGLPNPNVRLDL